MATKQTSTKKPAAKKVAAKKTPNATTKAAIKEAKAIKTPRFGNATDLINSLDKKPVPAKKAANVGRGLTKPIMTVDADAPKTTAELNRYAKGRQAGQEHKDIIAAKPAAKKPVRTGSRKVTSPSSLVPGPVEDGAAELVKALASEAGIPVDDKPKAPTPAPVAPVVKPKKQLNLKVKPLHERLAQTPAPAPRPAGVARGTPVATAPAPKAAPAPAPVAPKPAPAPAPVEQAQAPFAQDVTRQVPLDPVTRTGLAFHSGFVEGGSKMPAATKFFPLVPVFREESSVTNAVTKSIPLTVRAEEYEEDITSAFLQFGKSHDMFTICHRADWEQARYITPEDKIEAKAALISLHIRASGVDRLISLNPEDHPFVVDPTNHVQLLLDTTVIYREAGKTYMMQVKGSLNRESGRIYLAASVSNESIKPLGFFIHALRVR